MPTDPRGPIHGDKRKGRQSGSDTSRRGRGDSYGQRCGELRDSTSSPSLGQRGYSYKHTDSLGINSGGYYGISYDIERKPEQETYRVLDHSKEHRFSISFSKPHGGYFHRTHRASPARELGAVSRLYRCYLCNSGKRDAGHEMHRILAMLLSMSSPVYSEVTYGKIPTDHLTSTNTANVPRSTLTFTDDGVGSYLYGSKDILYIQPNGLGFTRIENNGGVYGRLGIGNKVGSSNGYINVNVTTQSFNSARLMDFQWNNSTSAAFGIGMIMNIAHKNPGGFLAQLTNTYSGNAGGSMTLWDMRNAASPGSNGLTDMIGYRYNPTTMVGVSGAIAPFTVRHTSYDSGNVNALFTKMTAQAHFRQRRQNNSGTRMSIGLYSPSLSGPTTSWSVLAGENIGLSAGKKIVWDMPLFATDNYDTITGSGNFVSYYDPMDRSWSFEVLTSTAIKVREDFTISFASSVVVGAGLATASTMSSEGHISFPQIAQPEAIPGRVYFDSTNKTLNLSTATGSFVALSTGGLRGSGSAFRMAYWDSGTSLTSNAAMTTDGTSLSLDTDGGGINTLATTSGDFTIASPASTWTFDDVPSFPTLRTSAANLVLGGSAQTGTWLQAGANTATFAGSTGNFTLNAAGGCYTNGAIMTLCPTVLTFAPGSAGTQSIVVKDAFEVNTTQTATTRALSRVNWKIDQDAPSARDLFSVGHTNASTTYVEKFHVGVDGVEDFLSGDGLMTTDGLTPWIFDTGGTFLGKNSYTFRKNGSDLFAIHVSSISLYSTTQVRGDLSVSGTSLVTSTATFGNLFMTSNSSMTITDSLTLSGSGSPPAGFALCIAAGGKLGHCTSIIGVSGDCTCTAP